MNIVAPRVEGRFGFVLIQTDYYGECYNTICETMR